MDAFIIEAKRTPMGRSHPEKGIFKDIRADELLSQLFTDFAERHSPGEIDDIFIGCVGQHLEQGKNIARLTAMLSGYPESVPGVTINRLCGSSLSAFNLAAQTLHCGQADLLLAGGVEHMHHVPINAAIDYHKELQAKYEFPFNIMGLTAEKVADNYKISKEEQDEFALESHRRAIEAQEAGHFDNEILPVKIGDKTISLDQCPRKDTNMEALGKLKTIFKEGGKVTAGNSSPLNDGASLTLLATEKKCGEMGLTKRAEVIDFTVIGLDPTVMGMGPLYAINKLLDKQNLTVDDIDLYEINEAFASQAIASVRELKIPVDKVNICGGAIALGHPLGCSGTRLIVTLLNNLERTGKETGIASMCIGHGQGIAAMIRRV